MNHLPIVKAYSFKGKLLLRALNGALRVLHLTHGQRWEVPPQYFHEDPRHFKWDDILFFAYKYYFKSPVKDDSDGAVVRFFAENRPVFLKNEGFEPLSTVTLAAAGDLMPYEWIQKRFCPHLWDDIGDDFFGHDVTFANLETPLDVAKPAALVPEVMLSDMHFNANEEMFDLFCPPQYRGFDVLSTANNHSLDMGEAGLLATIDFLEKRKIAHTGTARSATERLNFPFVERNGVRIAFVAYTFSMNQFTNPPDKPYLVNHLEVNQPEVDLMPLKKDILYCRTVLDADFVALSLHYGNAYQAYPGAHIVENTKRIFDECGPDIILGGHPHNVQPMAGYDFKCPLTQAPKRGFVLFSFSDFIAYDIFTWCHLSVYLKLTIEKGLDHRAGRLYTRLAHVEAVPVYACGVYQSAEKRDLRLLNAKKWLERVNCGEKPDFMTDWNVTELRGLMAFYDNYFNRFNG